MAAIQLTIHVFCTTPTNSHQHFESDRYVVVLTVEEPINLNRAVRNHGNIYETRSSEPLVRQIITSSPAFSFSCLFIFLSFCKLCVFSFYTLIGLVSACTLSTRPALRFLTQQSSSQQSLLRWISKL